MSTQFQRKIEDFECENCGFFVAGNGYTNHCPECLYSKHLDDFPGDRANFCGGMMKPISYLASGDESVLHRCEICGHEKWNKLLGEDDRDILISL